MNKAKSRTITNAAIPEAPAVVESAVAATVTGWLAIVSAVSAAFLTFDVYVPAAEALGQDVLNVIEAARLSAYHAAKTTSTSKPSRVASAGAM